jgi:hypothetical protein
VRNSGYEGVLLKGGRGRSLRMDRKIPNVLIRKKERTLFCGVEDERLVDVLCCSNISVVIKSV